MNKDKKLLKLDGFPTILQLSGIIDSIHDSTGLHFARKDINEISGLFRTRSSDDRFRAYYVLFKNESTFGLLSETCETTNDIKHLDCDGHMIRITDTHDTKLNSIIKMTDNDEFAIRLHKKHSCNLKSLTKMIEKIMSDKDINSTSSNELESIIQLNNGDFMMMTKDERTFKALCEKFSESKFNWRVSKTVPKPSQFSVGYKAEKPIKRKHSEPPTTNAPKQLKSLPESSNDKGFKKLKINEETRQLLALISSGQYDIYIKEKQDISHLFE